VATPIGNLEDITLRALRTLREAKLIAAEDTRQTKRLLSTYSIKTPLTSYHEHNKLTKLEYLLNYLQQEDVALVCDGGMPGISDPGYELIAAANRQGIPVVAIPGPSVITTALAVSGLPLGKFVYIGFLPRKAGERRRLLKSVAAEDGTIVILEAPHRLQAALSDILLVLGDRMLAVCRELTKIHEEVFRGSVSQAIDHFTEPRGEFTLVIEGKQDKDKPQLTEEVKRQLRSLRVSGRTAKQAIAEVAGETGLSKRALYQAWLESINVN
jgi:16S rRNA (cytidine1402-2'-O)-methyltransferase